MANDHSNSLVQRYHLPRADATCRLICFPHAGAGAAAFRELHPLLPDSVDVCSVRLPGRESRLFEPSLSSIEAIAEMLLGELSPEYQLPYAFLGQCSGALISFELSLRLMRRDIRQPGHVFILGQPAPGTDHGGDNETFAEFFADVAEYSIPEDFRGDQEFLELYEPALRADYSALSEYQIDYDAVINAPISACIGDQDQKLTLEDLAQWRDRTASDFTLRVLPGGHLLGETSRRAVARIVMQDWSPV